jgi:heme exporter protein D
MSEFLNMGGYAAYVWPSYGLTLTVIILNVLWARRLLARSRKEARRRLEMRGGEA